MKLRQWMASSAAALAAAGALFLAGCGSTGVAPPAQPVELAVTDATVPATATVGQPVTYTATVRLANTGQRFVRFGFGRNDSPYTVTAYGEQNGGGTATDRTEPHDGTLLFSEAGTYRVIFANSQPSITRTVTVQ
jgi:hypothetical protein